MDVLTGLGIFVGIGGIILGHLIEGGPLSSLMQSAAAIIVFGGTLGATLISNRWQDFKIGFRLLIEAFQSEDPDEVPRLAQEIIQSAQLVRRETLLSLETRMNTLSHPFLKNAFRLMIDGMEPLALQELIEKEIDLEVEKNRAGIKIWSDAGGFAPTMGIIGAVLGLIQVMTRLTDTSALGKGIAVAFVATIYGVGSANLFFLPVANKIKKKLQRDILLKEMIKDGAVAILKNFNPYIVEERMNSYVNSLELIPKPVQRHRVKPQISA